MEFSHVPVNLPKLLREEVDGVRCYATPDGKRYPSVTTVLSDYNAESIQAWRKRVGDKAADRISKAATDRGTAVHKLVEDYLNNKTPDLSDCMPNSRAIFGRMKKELNKLNNIHCLEKSLFSHELRLAGTVDCIAEYDGKLSVIDFKTSTRLKKKTDIRNYFMQAAAYATMYEEMTGNAIDNLIILIGVETSTFPQVMKDTRSNYTIDLNMQIESYYARSK
jgi:genome maintenance exonuclease 1